MTITTRQTTAAGVTNKNDSLTDDELDQNFVELANVKRRVTVSTTAPSTPSVNDIWVDTN